MNKCISYIEILAIILISIALSNFITTKLTNNQIEEAKELCILNGGLDYVIIYTLDTPKIHCINGLNRGITKEIQ